MGLFSWVEKKMKKMHWYDVSLVKLSSAAFALMIAKLWSPILSLDWYWYLVIALVFAIVPWCDLFRKK
ncbi:hypothetical protein JW826_03830 [Candidatus Woesearchaeota archaeon]|nr:hypothetical protein [Candidatus Woesearchaeota archaeon]